ncbi:hypothetical protein [Sphingomicrobium astaxanthinifaciens]|uniref:hypothetical protein n=1 Tax=Sphingomicrobium astaxanthinifaciens TaxID=1227949 RepID=UPI001FCBA60B|nr:hypothetical protein [Sphingomicrobium astaxanthinifaciens]MCJ7422032.1 hypothetical protein [Sphingomicrobium astaxanthinifaciens]
MGVVLAALASFAVLAGHWVWRNGRSTAGEIIGFGLMMAVLIGLPALVGYGLLFLLLALVGPPGPLVPVLAAVVPPLALAVKIREVPRRSLFHGAMAGLVGGLVLLHFDPLGHRG